MNNICTLLGLKIGQEFKIKGYPTYIFKFTDKELMYMKDGEWKKMEINNILVSLITKELEIDYAQYRPEVGKEYWYAVQSTWDHLMLNVTKTVWTNSLQDLMNYKCNNCFETKEDAERMAFIIRNQLERFYG